MTKVGLAERVQDSPVLGRELALLERNMRCKLQE